MPGIYTYRLGACSGAPAGLQTLFTVLENQHVIVRDLVYTNGGTTTATVSWSILSAGGTRTYLWSRSGVPAPNSDHLDLRQELRSGESLQVSSDVSGWSAAATGYVFQLRP